MTKVIAALAVAFLLVACDKPQPTERDKAEISQNMLGCLTSVTTKVGEEPKGIFHGLTSLAVSLSDINPQDMEKEWELLNNGSILLTVKTKKTRFGCNYVKDVDGNWYLSTAHRNDELVFNKEESDKNKERNVKLEEERNEAKRMEYVSHWHEREYSNVTYKYYELPNENSKPGAFSEPSIRIKCNPKGTRFEFDSPSISERLVEVSFDNGDVEKYQLTSTGAIGRMEKTEYSSFVVTDEVLDKQFREKLEKSKTVKIDGYMFKLGNLGEVPCK